MGINASGKEGKFNLCSCNQVHEKDKFCLPMMSMKIGSRELFKQKQTLNAKILLKLDIICDRNTHQLRCTLSLRTQLKIYGLQSSENYKAE